MTITENNFIFWTILEEDLKTIIPCHIKNVLNILGYGGALTFKSITDTDITEIENFVRNDLHGDLEARYDLAEELENEEFLALLFGHFNKDRSRFKFYFGEKKLIRELVLHTETVVDSPRVNAGLNHFAKKVTANKTFAFQSTLFCIKNSYFFTDRVAINSKQLNQFPINNGSGSNNLKKAKEISIDKEKNIIFKKVMKKISDFEEKTKVKRLHEFQLDFINLSGSTYNDMRSTVRCCFCAIPNRNSDVKIYLNRTASGGNWGLSNLMSHFTLHHMPKQNNNSTIVALKIEPFTLNVEESAQNSPLQKNAFIEDSAAQLSAQMAIQSIKMVNAAILNKEAVHHSKTKKKISALKTCQIEPDGDCLFSAIAHQLNQVKIGSVHHNNLTATLKRQVIEHIKGNINSFEGYLRGRLDEYKSKSDIKDMNEEFKEFLNVRLPLRLSWGGSESMKAVTELLKINILVINEFGDCSLGHCYRPEYNRSITLLFSSFKSNGNLNHYDSVIEISEDALTKFAYQAAEADWKYQTLLSKQNDEPQVVDDSD